MKVIFLDFDGVLVSFDYLRVTHLLQEEHPDEFGYSFDPRCIKHLQYILNKCPGTKIVISSSWKSMGFTKILKMWGKRFLPGEIIDITPDLGEERGREIAEWISQHCPVEKYVIIDDDSDMLLYQMDYFVKTNPLFGLTLDDSNKVIKILND